MKLKLKPEDLQRLVDTNKQGTIISERIETIEHLAGHDPVTVAELIDRVAKAQHRVRHFNEAIENMLRLINDALGEN